MINMGLKPNVGLSGIPSVFRNALLDYQRSDRTTPMDSLRKMSDPRNGHSKGWRKTHVSISIYQCLLIDAMQ
jgi:hypothetical protein